MKSTILQFETSLERPGSRFRFVFIVAAMACCSMFGTTKAVSPAPDGGYPGGNTAEGQNALLTLTSGTYNTAVGLFALTSNSSGNFNTATGAAALLVTTADENTASGAGALLSNTTGEANSAHGAFAMFNNTEGSNNTANGPEALFTNKTGGGNTATGAQALFFNDGDPTNEQGSENSAFGNGALFGNTTGYANSAFGSGALDLNNSGSYNTAVGFHAIGANFTLGDGAIATGDNNTAIGAFALSSNIQGGTNTAVGDEALLNNVDGFGNTGIGFEALANNTSGFQNAAVGYQALINCNTGAGNTGVGLQAGVNVTTASNVICIGSVGGDNIDNSCFIANIYSNIQPVIGTDPDYVTISSNGRLGRSNFNGSSRRFKHDIQPMDKASEVIFALRPVSFRYNKEYDPAERPSFGLIAEDVAGVAPDLVGRNKKGEPESVRYEQINAMLLNEFLKEHRKVQEQAREMQAQKATICDLKKGVETVVARLQEQESKIERISAERHTGQVASQAAVNDGREIRTETHSDKKTAMEIP